MTIEFFVPGIPVAKGSAKAFYNPKVKRAFVVQDNAARQKPWVSMIAVKAEAVIFAPIAGPVRVTLVFRMPRPKNHFGKKGLKSDAPILHSSRPDIDKLVRAVLDALTMIAWMDDSQVAALEVLKRYDDEPGVKITLEAADDKEHRRALSVVDT